MLPSNSNQAFSDTQNAPRALIPKTKRLTHPQKHPCLTGQRVKQFGWRSAMTNLTNYYYYSQQTPPNKWARVLGRRLFDLECPQIKNARPFSRAPKRWFGGFPSRFPFRTTKRGHPQKRHAHKLRGCFLHTAFAVLNCDSRSLPASLLCLASWSCSTRAGCVKGSFFNSLMKSSILPSASSTARLPFNGQMYFFVGQPHVQPCSQFTT